MVDLKDDIAVIITSVSTGVFAFLSWFYQSGLFGTVTGLIIGAGITYFVQGRTQKRTWKREYTIKTIEQVYSKLYGEMKIILSDLKRESLDEVFVVGNWSQIENDHRYFMIDEKFRERLAQFYKALTKYNSAVSEFNWITSHILVDSAKTIFNREPENTPSLDFTYYIGKQKHSIQPAAESYLRRLQTLEQMEKNLLLDVNQTTTVSNKQFVIRFNFTNYAAPPSNHPPMQTSFEDDNIQRVSAYWEKCLQTFRESKNYISAVKEKPALLKEADEIMKLIEKRISEPWKI